MILDYLYYKLYQAALKSSLNDIPEFMAPVFLGGLLGINILVIGTFLVKIDILPFFFSNGKYAVGTSLALILLMFFTYRKKKMRMVLSKYSKENNKQRIKGNIIVSIYVALSFLLIFVVAFYKPGKL